MKVKSNSFRRLDDPSENSKSAKYVFYVKVRDVIKNIPMATNPRDQKLNTDVAKAIQESLESNDGYFHLKNRGIVLSAASVNYNNRTEEVTIFFDDDEKHGNVDGGHTYKIVCDHLDGSLSQFVQFEVMTGVEDIIEQLAEARNTSIQVDVKSMAELANHFDPIKEALDGMPFFSRIAFKQNQVTQDTETGKSQRMIDAREIVAIINMFDSERFDEGNHPIQAYSSKAKMLEYYLENPEKYRKLVNVSPDIFDLYDVIELEFADAYNNGGGRYGRKKYSGFKNNRVVGKSKFGMQDLFYKIPNGLIYPVVAAFRCLLEYNFTTEKYEWKKTINGPIAVWEDCKQSLATKVVGFASSIGDNPNAVGKDPNVWDIAYMTVQQKLLGA